MGDEAKSDAEGWWSEEAIVGTVGEGPDLTEDSGRELGLGKEGDGSVSRDETGALGVGEGEEVGKSGPL